MCRLIFRPVGVTSGVSDGCSLWIDNTVRSKIVDLIFLEPVLPTGGDKQSNFLSHGADSSGPRWPLHVVSFSCLKKIQTWLRQVKNDQIMYVL